MCKGLTSFKKPFPLGVLEIINLDEFHYIHICSKFMFVLNLELLGFKTVSNIIYVVHRICSIL